MIRYLLLFTLVISQIAHGEDKSQGERMLLALGMDKVFSEQKIQLQQESKRQVNIVMRQLDEYLANKPNDRKAVEAVMNQMMENLHNSWSVEVALKIYGDAWSKIYGEQKVEQLIEKYSQPSARKEVEAIMATNAALFEYIASSYRGSMEKEMVLAMEKIKEIARSN